MAAFGNPYQSPLGGFTDSTYQAENAQLNFNLAQKRMEILRALGYNQGGQHVMGDIEIDLGRNVADLERNRGLAVEGVTNAMRDRGTLFSGIRAQEQSRAEFPFVQQVARSKGDAARAIVQLYQMLADVERERSVNQGLLLADAAQRRAQALMQRGGIA